MKAYLCDHRHNESCAKTSCHYNEYAVNKDCFLTLDPEYAVIGRDGEPIVFDETEESLCEDA